MHPRAGFLLCAVVGLAALSAACGQTRAAEEPPPIPVGVGVVETHAAATRTPYSASIVPYTQVDLAFKSGGYIESVFQVRGADGRRRNIQEGDWVARGTLLARVQDTEYRATVNGAQAQVAQAQAALEQARLDFERTDALFLLESVTKPQHDAAKARLDSAAASVTAAESAFERARSALNDCSLHAPIAGFVLRRSVEVGSLVGPATPGFSIADTRLVKAVFGVPDLVVPSLALGAPQVITTPAAPSPFNGRITAIAQAADARTRTFSIEVTVPNARNLLRPGMIATLTLSGPTEGTPIPVVPLGAVVRAQDNPNAFGVFVVEQRGDQFIARARTVDLGAAYGSMIAFKGPLEPGDRIIITGATQVHDGQRVQAVR